MIDRIAFLKTITVIALLYCVGIFLAYGIGYFLFGAPSLHGLATGLVITAMATVFGIILFYLFLLFKEY
jgi:hypothetical protein